MALAWFREQRGIAAVAIAGGHRQRNWSEHRAPPVVGGSASYIADGTPAARGPCALRRTRRICPVRHWLIVLLLVVVPLQLAWAGAAVYCGHESAVAGAKHLGHHEHAHQPSDGGASVPVDDADMSSAFHADCETCHLGASVTLTIAPLDAAILPNAGLLGASLPRYLSHIPAGPERPDRSLPPLSRDATTAPRSVR